MSGMGMGMMGNHDMMQGLVGLLGESNKGAENDAPNMVRGEGGKRSYVKAEKQVVVKKHTDKKKDKDDIWKEADLKAASGVVLKTQGDDRPEPKYDILLRQDLSTADTYLNLGDRNPGSDHCDTIVVKIWMPDTEMKNIDLEVLKDRVLINAPKHRLNLALPHNVKKDEGKAQWEKLKACLILTLPIELEIRYIQNLGDALDKTKM